MSEEIKAKMEAEINNYTDPDVKDIVQSYSESTPEEATSKVKEELQDLENVTLNIAITGMTGAGKSSYVNAIRGLRDDEEGSAATGVTETTQEPTMFIHPTMPNVKIWDLPGIGSPKFKAKQYLKDVKFKTYDFFIIITSERFKENDITLAKAIKKKKKLYYFVRSKIDNDIRAEERKAGFNEQQLLSKIREDCKLNLKKAGNPKVFLVSSFDLGKYDFQNLVDTLEKELPLHKRLALVQSLPVCSMDVLERKNKTFKKMVWLTAFGSGAIAMAPIPGLSLACDIGIMISFFRRCFRSFGLDEKSLQTLSERVNKPVDELKSAMKSRFTEGVNRKVVLKFFSSSKIGAAITIEYMLSTIPVVGTLAAGGVSFATVWHLLNLGLDEMAEDARAVLVLAGLDSPDSTEQNSTEQS